MARYSLDKQTGEVRRISEMDDDDSAFEDDEDESTEESESNPDRWIHRFAYHEQRMKQVATEWLEAKGIEAELV
jgi:hypothetical protein